MKLRLMDLIVCPDCGGPFQLDEVEHEILDYSESSLAAAEKLWRKTQSTQRSSSWDGFITKLRHNVVTGGLRCDACHVDYRIDRGIPRILPEYLRTAAGQLGRGNPEADERLRQFLDDADLISEDTDQFRDIQLANQSNYGYEWQVFSHEYDQWRELYSRYSGVPDPSTFEGMLGLDAGCGMARYTLIPANNGAEIVGLDLSNAVEAAYRKSRNAATLHVVQGDIFRLPFAPETFDFAQSLGVIHITPNPDSALTSILRALKPDSPISLYVYSNFEEESKTKYHLLKVVTTVRRLTVKLPSPVLYRLLYVAVPPVILFLYYPSKALWLLGFRRLSMQFPYSYDQYRNRRFRDIHMNLFDRFGNPVERRYSRDQMNAWMERAGIVRYVLDHRDGWVVRGSKSSDEAPLFGDGRAQVVPER